MELCGDKVTFSGGLCIGIKVDGRIRVVLIIREWTTFQGRVLRKLCEVWILESCCFK